MAQTSFHLDRVAHKQLEVEKFGVIAGFLLGLPLAVGVVSDVLVAQGAPDFLVALGVVMTVALTTAAGLRVGAALAARLVARR
ncbi:MAG: hypothetical protein Q7U09_15380 [Hydrogenophaga sp.]|nr:hypothetical protein [Hydrogenophaga sp.]